MKPRIQWSGRSWWVLEEGHKKAGTNASTPYEAYRFYRQLLNERRLQNEIDRLMGLKSVSTMPTLWNGCVFD